jgi:drug/metabolite transporter (DMT)-like permease
MRDHSSAIVQNFTPLPDSATATLYPGTQAPKQAGLTSRASQASGTAGLAWGALGVLAFSWSVPLTRLAVTDGLSPSFIAYGRAVVPALISIVLLRLTRQRRPVGREWASLAVVAVCCGFGFALLTSLAAKSVPASHSAVIIGLVPLTTAACAVLRTSERPRPAFWLASAAGAVAVAIFAGIDRGGLGDLGVGDAYLFAAVVTAALGYAEGAIVARSIGAWQTICWGLIVALPATLPLALASLPSVLHNAAHLGTAAIVSFAYLSLVSMFLGFFPWYRGLAIGPVSRVSQTQLMQPMLSILWAALVLGEHPGPASYAGVFVVLAAAVVAIRARTRS